MSISPFENEAEVVEIGDLTIENRMDRVTIHGAVDITLDQEGLKRAQHLSEILSATLDAMKALEAEGRLPKTVETAATTMVKNPFA